MSNDKPKYYWDSCMFYEVLGDEPASPERKKAASNILEENKKGGNVIMTSIVTHLEVIPRKIDGKSADAERKYISLFDGSHFVDVEISRNILLRAREIKDYYRPPDEATGRPAKILDSGDAIHLATASIYEATEFHTRDDSQRGTKIPLVSLYAWSGEDKLCGKYRLPIVCPEEAQKEMGFEHHEEPEREGAD